MGFYEHNKVGTMKCLKAKIQSYFFIMNAENKIFVFALIQAHLLTPVMEVFNKNLKNYFNKNLSILFIICLFIIYLAIYYLSNIFI